MDENVRYAIRLERGTGIKDGWDGMCEGNMVASYTHIHRRASSKAKRRLCTPLQAGGTWETPQHKNGKRLN